jgi:hypothetical protein
VAQPFVIGIRIGRGGSPGHLSWPSDLHLDVLDSVFALVDSDVTTIVGAAIEEFTPVALGWQGSLGLSSSK